MLFARLEQDKLQAELARIEIQQELMKERALRRQAEETNRSGGVYRGYPNMDTLIFYPPVESPRALLRHCSNFRRNRQVTQHTYVHRDGRVSPNPSFPGTPRMYANEENQRQYWAPISRAFQRVNPNERIGDSSRAIAINHMPKYVLPEDDSVEFTPKPNFLTLIACLLAPLKQSQMSTYRNILHCVRQFGLLECQQKW